MTSRARGSLSVQKPDDALCTTNGNGRFWRNEQTVKSRSADNIPNTDTRVYGIIVYANVIIIICNVTRVVFTITNGAGYNLCTDNSSTAADGGVQLCT